MTNSKDELAAIFKKLDDAFEEAEEALAKSQMTAQEVESQAKAETPWWLRWILWR